MSSSGGGSSAEPQHPPGQGRSPWPPVEVIGLMLLLLLGVGYLVVALDLDAGGLGRPGGGFLPRVIGVLIIGSAALALLQHRRHVAQGAAQDDDPGDEEFGDAVWRIPVLIVVVLGYVVLAPLAGHLVVGSLMCFVVLLVLKARPWWQSALVGVAFGLMTHFAFRVLLDVALPVGRWWS